MNLHSGYTIGEISMSNVRAENLRTRLRFDERQERCDLFQAGPHRIHPKVISTIAAASILDWFAGARGSAGDTIFVSMTSLS